MIRPASGLHLALFATAAWAQLESSVDVVGLNISQAVLGPGAVVTLDKLLSGARGPIARLPPGERTIKRWFDASAFAAPPPPPPAVSYVRQIAPLLAMRCNSCHGEAGGLNTRGYATLMAGGNLGRVVIAGNSDGSLLVHFVEGRRGEAHRMPAGGRALSSGEIQMIRQWIDEGAKQDEGAPSGYSKVLERVAVSRDRAVRLVCRVKRPSYLTMTVRDRSGRLLLERVASVKAPKEEADAGEPGDLIEWEVRAGVGWPKTVRAELRVEYGGADARETEFAVVGK